MMWNRNQSHRDALAHLLDRCLTEPNLKHLEGAPAAIVKENPADRPVTSNPEQTESKRHLHRCVWHICSQQPRHQLVSLYR